MENIRVLIVDDLPHVRQGLAAVIKLASMKRRLGVDVIGEAQNGLEAIQGAHALHPDVILMDLEMPVLDGYEATRRIKAELPGLRVVVLSVHAGPDEKERARAAGADDFVVKGASYKVLLDAILKVDANNHKLPDERGV